MRKTKGSTARTPRRPPAKSRSSAALVEGGMPMGPGGPLHPPIGMGLWAIGRWAEEDEKRTRSTLVRALELGIRWFDTAEVYGTGRSERLLGNVLPTVAPPPEGLLVGTKVSWDHLRPEQVRAALLGSLRRLGLPGVGLYLVHAPDPRVPIADTMHALEALWKERRIAAIGVSNFSVEELEAAQAALSEARIVVNQVRYNLFDREDGDAVLEYCRSREIVVEAYTPLLRGLLAGRYLDGSKPPSEVRTYTHRLLGDESLPGVIARATRLRSLAKSAKVPMASLALHWLRRRGAAPVFGASRPEQVEEAVEAWRAVPDDNVLEEADRIARDDDSA